MTRGLARFAAFAMLALTLSGQAFAVSSTRDNDAALRAMMDDRPHAPDARSQPATAPPATSDPEPQTQGPPDAVGREASDSQGKAQSSDQDASPDADAPSSESSDGEAAAQDAPQGDAIQGEPSEAKEGEAPVSETAQSGGEEPAAESKGGSWLSNMLPSIFGGGEKSEPKADAKTVEEHATGDGVAAPAADAAGDPEHAASEEAQSHEGAESARPEQDHADQQATPSGEGEAAHEASSEGEAAAQHEAAQDDTKPEGFEHAQTDAASNEGEAAPEGEHSAKKEDAPKAEESSSWLSYIPFLGGSSKTEDPKADAGAHGEAPPADAAQGEHAAAVGGEHASAEAASGPEGEVGKDAHAAKDAPKAEESSSWLSYIPFLGGSSKTEEPKGNAAAHGEAAAGEAAPKDEHAAADGGEHATAESAPSPEGEAKPADGHGDTPKDDKAHAAKSESGGGWMSYIPFMGGGKSDAKPEKAAVKDGHGDKKDAHGEAAKDGQAEAPAEGHGEAPAEGHGEAAAEEGHGGEAEHAEGPPPPPPMWPDEPAVEEAQQPYVRVRQLRRLQDSVAKGSIAAYDQQKTLMRELAEEMRGLPPEVWDDTRNVRAAIYFVLTGGDPRVLMAMLERETPIYVPRRLIRAALAYGEGRTVDAKQSFDKVEPEMLAPELQGMVALIKGTLLSKNEPEKAIKYFDKARLYAPGALVEESALRQQILLVAKEGDMKRFDFLSSAYARRFPRSLFARNFRRQLFAGVAKQVFKGENEWISRTETEMQRLPPGERAGLYLSIAEEATRGGHIKIAQFAASKAAALYPQGSRELDRARLYEGAVLVATKEREKGVELLTKVRPQILKPTDRELYDAAQLVATAGLPRSAAPRQFADEKPPPSVVKAEDLLKSTEALLAEETQ